MILNLIVIDNFYSNPDKVREFALSQDFSTTGNFPGARTKPLMSNEAKNAINEIMAPVGPIRNWYDTDEGYTGCFQYCTALDRTWIHSDVTTKWAGVCYLTPDPPVSAGTGIFRYKSNKSMEGPNIYPSQDYTKWELVDRIGNLYNRLIIYRGDLYHTSLDYFGQNKEDSRLFQTFFFDT